jgi:cystathionine beta-lyase/cystathionine gamma-synthase
MVGLIGCLLKYTTIQASSFTVDMNDLDNITAVKTKMIWVKTPTNPLMKLADILQLQQLLPKKHTSRGR